ncbi:MAG: T9SS type A sorting domain-containing protein [Saprospiraceae bacterium]|nr:T9SS type A sorting domain-containing protein [Saprospiraceae bacterium]
MKRLLFGLALLLFPIFTCFSQQTTTVKIMTYNLLNFPSPANTNSLGNDNARINYFKTIVENNQADAILIQELTNANGATSLVNALNSSAILTGAGKFYNRATLFTSYPLGASSGLGNMLIYNDNVFDLISQVNLGRNSVVVNGQTSEVSPRAATAYLLNIRPTACANESVPIYLIGAHLKGSDSQTDENARLAGANDIMNYINNTIASPTTTNVIIAGDFNFYDTNEKGYNLFLNGTASGTNLSYQNTFIDKLGAWTRNSSASVSKFTQATRTVPNQFGNGGVDGGLDDRFDFILINETINANVEKVAYQNGSYQNFGNTGVPLNGDASQSNSPVATSLLRMSDHFPVLLNITVSCTVTPTCNITNASASNTRCEGQDFKFEVNFTPTNGSGAYQVMRASDNVVLASGNSSPIAVTIANNTSDIPFNIFVRDANNINCLSTNVQITPQNCAPSNSLCLLEEDFEGFAGAGVVPTPNATQLDSDDWTFVGFSDEADLARGTTFGGVTIAGLYSRNEQSNESLWIQPTADKFTPGTATLRVCNNTALPSENLSIEYQLTAYNDESRSSSFNFSYSFNNINYINVSALDYTSPTVETGDFITMTKQTTLTGSSLGVGQCVFLRWTSDDVGGIEARDEFGLDDIRVCGTPTTPNDCPTNLIISSNPIPETTYTASETITSTGFSESGTIVIFEAGTQINLLNGFTAEQGTIFTARIANCAPALSTTPIENRTFATESPAVQAPNIQLFPNPANDLIQITVEWAEKEQPVLLTIFNAQGKVVQTFRTEAATAPNGYNFEWNCSEMPSGLYWLLCNGKYTKPVVVLHD